MDHLLVIRPEAWHWVTLGFVLMALEIVLPETLFLWFGIAGVATGATLFLVDMPTAYQIGLYGAFALLSYVPVRIYVRRWQQGDMAAARGLNQRAQSLVGQRVGVTEPVVNGFGAARVGDSRWRIACAEDLEVGASAEVLSVVGTTLQVRRVTAPAAVPEGSEPAAPISG
ncbi:NfeD family protein [Thalassobaculum sp. OXR-137]|uniref:NfeD family protein n=1 Tax=Thalassobaculum sp. OXR-137 TaxID=3100173 RepID=UPI002AC9B3AC|nr:NfeD family protein [Thalassobaculum sp. OXR-137]WPZ34687.1 NfeD family protein [Thalassobaculum sp. OXR-137]